MQPIERPFFAAVRKDRPEVIAHRGGAGEWPAETILAFDQAIKLGVDVLEMDVRRTKDDHIVLMHNMSVKKTTGGRGFVCRLTINQIRKLNAAARWATNPAIPFTPVPELSAVFALAKKYPNLRFNIEIKPLDWSLSDTVGKMICANGLADRVLLASAWTSVLKIIRKRYPSIATSASVLEIGLFQISRLLKIPLPFKGIDAIQWRSRMCKLPIITPKFVSYAKKRGKIVHAWTVNEPEEMARMIELGVDGIITDYPTTLLRMLS